MRVAQRSQPLDGRIGESGYLARHHFTLADMRAGMNAVAFPNLRIFLTLNPNRSLHTRYKCSTLQM